MQEEKNSPKPPIVTPRRALSGGIEVKPGQTFQSLTYEQRRQFFLKREMESRQKTNKDGKILESY